MTQTQTNQSQNYVNTQTDITIKYLEAEMEVIKSVKSWEVGTEILSQLPDRAMKVVKEHMPADREGSTLMKEAYLNRVSRYLESQSHYDPMVGSFWEDVGSALKDLSSRVLRI